MKCPVCGSAIEDFPIRALLYVHCTRSERLITAMLIEAYPDGITFEKIINELYGLDPNGGPENPRRTIHVFIASMRKKLKPMGWKICRAQYDSGLYRLEKIEDA